MLYHKQRAVGNRFANRFEAERHHSGKIAEESMASMGGWLIMNYELWIIGSEKGYAIAKTALLG